jgi:phage/plasmid-associated DNA primase
MYQMLDVEILSPAVALRQSAEFEQAGDGGLSTVEPVRGTVTEHAVAVELTRRYAGSLRFCHAAQKWFLWNGQFWQVDTTQRTEHAIRNLACGASQYEDHETQVRVQKSGFVNGVNKLCHADPSMAVDITAWDRDKLKLGTPNGTVNLRSAMLERSDPNDGITKTTSIAPAELANCPRWLRFLDETTGATPSLSASCNSGVVTALREAHRSMRLYSSTGVAEMARACSSTP